MNTEQEYKIQDMTEEKLTKTFIHGEIDENICI